MLDVLGWLVAGLVGVAALVGFGLMVAVLVDMLVEQYIDTARKVREFRELMRE